MERKRITCLDRLLQEVYNTELTQQIKLSEGMPDVGQILSAWGQMILRSKQWRDGELTATGGMMVWVLYTPENGGQECCLDSWIPFQMQWDLPEDIPEGNVRIQCLTRFVDARSSSPRKISIRCGGAARAEVYVSVERELVIPGDMDGVEILRTDYPMHLLTEVGEQSVSVEETLKLPEMLPEPKTLLYSRMTPCITEQRVIGDKLALQGSGELHLLYRCEEDRLCSWDVQVPFSQVISLDGEYGAEARADTVPVLTDLETELDSQDCVRLRCGICAQYRISDKKTVSVAEDTYSTRWELAADKEMLEIPVILEHRQEMLCPEYLVMPEAEYVSDISFWPDFPRFESYGTGVNVVVPGVFQILYYEKDGTLHCKKERWEQTVHLEADSGAEPDAAPVPMPLRTVAGDGKLLAKSEMPMQLQWMTRQQIPMVTDIRPGEKMKPDGQRPALILRRAGDERLWDIAKGNGSTVEDIRRANGLQGEPAPEQMLLIPVR